MCNDGLILIAVLTQICLWHWTLIHTTAQADAARHELCREPKRASVMIPVIREIILIEKGCRHPADTHHLLQALFPIDNFE